jgi:hypothetical protein
MLPTADQFAAQRALGNWLVRDYSPDTSLAVTFWFSSIRNTRQ